MTPDMKKAIKEAVAEAIKPLEARLDKKDRQRNMALLTAALCLIGAAFSVGYAIKSNEALSDQSQTNRIVVCATARSTALAFRSPQVTETKSGERRREGRNHYLERLVGWRETLLASGHLDCPDIKGFDTFEYLRGKALADIDRILLQQAPNKARELGVDRETNTTSSNETPAGVGTILESPDESTEDSGSTAAPSHPQINGDGNTGGSNHIGGSGNGGEPKPAPQSEPSEPGPTGEPGASGGAGGTSGTGGEGDSGGESNPESGEEESSTGSSGDLLPGLTKPVEEGVCHSVLGKLVCTEIAKRGER